MRRFQSVALLGALLISAAASAAPVSSYLALATGPTKVPVVKFTDYRLPNGLRVLLCVDHSAPVFAVSVTYNVGSRNEHPGRTGFAHLFEHMMFQGSANVGKGEHMLLIQDNGGTMNGTTNTDRTNYFETLPSNQIDLGLFLESDRMRSLDISQATLDNQRAVVQEEKRQSYDNQPYGALGETMDKMLYNSFAYQHTTIGSMDDLNAATLDDVKQFFKTYYAPNNAALAVVGDFNEGDIKKKIEKYFGSIPRQPDPPPAEVDEHLGTEEQRKTITDPLARLVRYESAYKTVPGNDPDSAPLQLLASILSRGRNSVIYNSIVEKHLANQANIGSSAGRGPGQFSCSATLGPDNDVKPVEAAFDAAIEDVQEHGVTADQLKKAKMLARAASIVGFGGGGRRGGGGGGGGLTSDLGRANALTQNAIFYNDPGRMNTALATLEAVTLDDIQRVAKKYLVKTNRVVVIVMPESNDGGFGGAF